MSDLSHELVSLINKRFDIIRSLYNKPQSKPELVEDLEISRSTVDRGIASLKEYNCTVRDQNGKFSLTNQGILLFENHISSIEYMKGINEAGEILSSTDVDEIGEEFLSGMEVCSGNSCVPEAAIEPIIEIIENATKVTGVIDEISLYQIHNLKSQVEQRNLEVKLVINKEVIDSLLNIARQDIAFLIRSNSVEILQTENPIPFSAWSIVTGEESYSAITVHDNGATQGVLINNMPESVEWAENNFTEFEEKGLELNSENI